jgi:hypothetical protein
MISSWGSEMLESVVDSLNVLRVMAMKNVEQVDMQEVLLLTVRIEGLMRGFQREMVKAARDDAYTWPEIAQPLCISPQGAAQRYTD